MKKISRKSPSCKRQEDVRWGVIRRKSKCRQKKSQSLTQDQSSSITEVWQEARCGNSLVNLLYTMKLREVGDDDSKKAVKKMNSQNLWPWINSTIDSLMVSKNRAECRARVFFWRCDAPAAKFSRLDNSSRSEKAFPGFFGDFFGRWTPSKRNVFVHKNSLTSCQQCRHSRGVEPGEYRQSLTIVIFMLRVLTYVVSYKLFLNWIIVFRFASHEI